jgi:hypothetical protein
MVRHLNLRIYIFKLMIGSCRAAADKSHRHSVGALPKHGFAPGKTGLQRPSVVTFD